MVNTYFSLVFPLFFHAACAYYPCLCTMCMIQSDLYVNVDFAPHWVLYVITVFENKDMWCGQTTYITGSAILAFWKIFKTIISGLETYFWTHYTNISVKDLEMTTPKGKCSKQRTRPSCEIYRSKTIKPSTFLSLHSYSTLI